MVDRRELFYLNHVRSQAATAQGKNTTGHRTVAAGTLDGTLAIVLAIFAVLTHLCIRILVHCLRCMCGWCIAHVFALPLTWNVCVAVTTGMPLQVLAGATALEGSTVGMVLLLLWACGMHLPRQQCRCFSAACVAFLPGSASLAGIVAIVSAYYDPAFPRDAQREDGAVDLDEETEAEERALLDEVDGDDFAEAEVWESLEGVELEDAIPESLMPSDQEMQQRLAALPEALLIREASAERNNCLIDSAVQALVHAGALWPLSAGDRRLVHLSARAELQALRLINPPDATGYYPMLEHDVHFHPVMQYLCRQHSNTVFWRVEPREASVTACVHDRTHRHRVAGNGGVFDELPDPHPVTWQGEEYLQGRGEEFVLLLYCNTALVGEYYRGVHYEWLEPQARGEEDGEDEESEAPSLPLSDSGNSAPNSDGEHAEQGSAEEGEGQAHDSSVSAGQDSDLDDSDSDELPSDASCDAEGADAEDRGEAVVDVSSQIPTAASLMCLSEEDEPPALRAPAIVEDEPACSKCHSIGSTRQQVEPDQPLSGLGLSALAPEDLAASTFQRKWKARPRPALQEHMAHFNNIYNNHNNKNDNTNNNNGGLLEDYASLKNR
jgi:hypothetical protein